MKEGIYSDTPLACLDVSLSEDQRNLHFAMFCNGYIFKDNEWIFSPTISKLFVREEFTGQRVAFFGPNNVAPFYSGINLNYNQFREAFNQPSVSNLMGKYRALDEGQAARIAFILGGLVRHIKTVPYPPDPIMQAVNFVSRMAMLGEEKSGDAIASAMAMYVISGGPLEEDNSFKGAVFNMSEAIRADPITPQKTIDLGLSQVARLRSFNERTQFQRSHPFPDITHLEESFKNFPTVGAEFHFPADVLQKSPNFWQRVAILNMSQYQRGSYIQLSRHEEGLIEMRMNPSIYPVTIANWNHMRLLFPELDSTYFTITTSRLSKNFDWTDDKDKSLINSLRAVGMLCYAGVFANIPTKGNQAEINFGSIYLGQTVRMADGKYKITGDWNGGSGISGQLSIYAGFGDTLSNFAYYLSMSLANRSILDPFGRVYSRVRLSSIQTLNKALEVPPVVRRYVFEKLQSQIEQDKRLKQALGDGKEIIRALNP